MATTDGGAPPPRLAAFFIPPGFARTPAGPCAYADCRKVPNEYSAVACPIAVDGVPHDITFRQAVVPANTSCWLKGAAHWPDVSRNARSPSQGVVSQPEIGVYGLHPCRRACVPRYWVGLGMAIALHSGSPDLDNERALSLSGGSRAQADYSMTFEVQLLTY